MKYEIIGDTSIIIDLHNGYSILAMSRIKKKDCITLPYTLRRMT